MDETVQKSSTKMVLVKTLQNFTRGLRLYEKEAPKQEFFPEFCEKFKNTSITEHLRATTSAVTVFNNVKITDNIRKDSIRNFCCFPFFIDYFLNFSEHDFSFWSYQKKKGFTSYQKICCQ